MIWKLWRPKSLGMRTPSREGPTDDRNVGGFSSTDSRSVSDFSLHRVRGC